MKIMDKTKGTKDYYDTNNIIFIEGVSGVGKTTITAHLCDKLQSIGYKAKCYLEGDCDNPLDPFKGRYPSSKSLSEFCEAYFQYWQNYVKNHSSNSNVLVLDGTLFHHPINDLLRIYNATDEFITSQILSMLSVIQPLYPIVFYLSSDDVGESLRKARINRSQPIASEEKISYWENRKRVDLHVLDRILIKSHIINIDDGWDSICEMITEYLIYST